MRFTIAYYLIFLYATVILKPLIPIGKDFIAHSFFETIHIATVHAVYGSNHLQKEIAESNADDVNNKHHKNALANETQVQVHLPVYQLSSNPQDDIHCLRYLFLILCKPESGFASKYSPPPDLI